MQSPKMKTPNGGIDRARTQRRKVQVVDRSPLNALRSNDLFERRWIVTRFWFLVIRNGRHFPSAVSENSEARERLS
jgi:hypothetical protein